MMPIWRFHQKEVIKSQVTKVDKNLTVHLFGFGHEPLLLHLIPSGFYLDVRTLFLWLTGGGGGGGGKPWREREMLGLWWWDKAWCVCACECECA